MYRIALIALMAALVVPVAGARSTGGSISLVAYSTPKAAFSTIIPAFNQTAAGQGVSFTQSYGPSADQANAVVNGLPADVLDLSLEPDMRTLVKAGLVAPTWNANKYKGIITHSVVVIVFRSGNPKHIHSWSDLTKAGVKFEEVGTSATEGAPEYNKISAWYAGHQDAKWLMAVDSGDSNAVAQFIQKQNLKGKVGADVTMSGVTP